MKSIEQGMAALAKKIEARRLLQESPVDDLSASFFEFDTWCARNPAEWQSLICSMGGDTT